ncbi:hypothetical protein MIND_00474400 [Mycena indigotica]|uniref:Uncharacterized protein n=1 Tax=Mycena indigotica TaxID=2126181 RepID=A0A8H6SXA2_9AGAR|nr:uncharacterized protein MIND_00474400 [Mycena indigotica]KAF7306825.1 hypothetical protein MIND_00474400 [Mycena indigotica]
MFVTRPIVAILSVVAVANGAPQLASIFDTLTSGAVSVATQVGGGAASVATQVGGGAASIATQLGSDFTSVGGGVFKGVTSVGGRAVTVITSAGGEGFTLATDGAGRVTTFAGQVYTAAVVGNGTANAAVYATPISPSLAVGLLTVLASTCLGVVITI